MCVFWDVCLGVFGLMREPFAAVYAAGRRGFQGGLYWFGLMREPFAAVHAVGRRGGSGWFVLVRAGSLESRSPEKLQGSGCCNINPKKNTNV